LHQLKQFGIGGLAAGPSFSATGGTITDSGGKTIHTFTSSGTFSDVSGGAGTVECLVLLAVVVEEHNHGGGGGAGGFRTASDFQYLLDLM
jgi:hypothetical protein